VSSADFSVERRICCLDAGEKSWLCFRERDPAKPGALLSCAIVPLPRSAPRAIEP